MNLALRNRIAGWLLEALATPEADVPVRALVSFARSADESGAADGLDATEIAALETGESLFERHGGGARLRSDLVRDLGPLRERALRFERALAEARRRCGPAPAGTPATGKGPGEPPNATQIAWLLRAAAVLHDAGLWFEVHEMLEPAWGRSGGDLRAFLQGIIQVAVGFHHHANGNLRGALSLLSDGNEKLRRFRPEAWGVDLEELCTAVDHIEIEVRGQIARGAPAPLTPPRLRVRAPD